MKNLPSAYTSAANITLLSILPADEDRQILQCILGQDGWNIEGVRSVREAAKFLENRNTQLVMCDRNLPDGSWKDVLRLANRSKNNPALVVVSRQADERFWAEVLNLGAYDVVLKPFDRSEVSGVLRMALGREHAPELEYASV